MESKTGTQNADDSHSQKSILSVTSPVSGRPKRPNPSVPISDRAKALERRQMLLGTVKEKFPERTYRAIAGTPDRYLNSRLKAVLGLSAPRAAIKAKCEDCVGYEEIQARVGDCQSFSCPIWFHRPYQTKANETPRK